MAGEDWIRGFQDDWNRFRSGAPEAYVTPPFGVNVPSNNPYAAVRNAQARLAASGLQVPQEEKPGFGQVIFNVLDTLDKPRNAVFTGIKYASRGQDFFTGAGRGWSREEVTRGEEFLPESLPRPVRWIGGTVLDILGDPTTWITGGTAKLGQTALFGARTVAQEAQVANRIRKALSLGEGAYVGRDAVEAGLQTAKGAITPATAAAKESLLAARRSANYFMPGVEDLLNPDIRARLGRLQELVSVDKLKPPVDLESALAGKFGSAPTGLDRRKFLDDVFGSKVPTKPRANFDKWASKYVSAFEKSTDEDFVKSIVDAYGTVKGTGTKATALWELARKPVLPKAIADLDDKGKTAAYYLSEVFGGTGLDVGTAAERLAKNVAGKGGGIEGLLGRLGKAAGAGEALTKAKGQLELMNGLSAEFEKSTGRYFLKYFGKPIVDVAPVGRAVFDNVLFPAYQKIPGVKQITDLWGELFLPHYIKLSDAIHGTIGPALRTIERGMTALFRKENALPMVVVESAHTLMGREFIENPKLNKYFGYYMEDIMARAKLPELRKMVEAGRPGAEYFVEAAEEAATYWKSIAGQFTPEELKLLADRAQRLELDNRAIAKIDDAIGRKYDPVEIGYFYHVYKEDDKVVKEKLRALLGQRERLRKHLSTSLKGGGTGDPEHVRQLLTLAYAKKVGLHPLEDAITSVAIRKLKTQQAQYHYDLASTILENKAIVSAKPVAGWVYVGDIVPRLEGKFVHPEVARQLKRSEYLFFTDSGFEEVMRYVAKATNIIKAVQVGYNPSFTVRNIVGEGLMNLFAGVSLRSHELARRALAGEAGLQKWVKEFQEQGGWYAGVTRGNLAQSVRQTTEQEAKVLLGGKRHTVDVIMPGTKIVPNPNVIREISDYGDKLYRMAHYIDRRMKGLGVEEAMSDVRKFHVDYQDLTLTEKKLFRNIVPYYTYLRKNLPIQLRIMLEQPGYLTAVSKLVANASTTLGSPMLSRYATENLALPLYQKEDGDVQVLNWNLPIMDLGRIHTNLEGNFREQMGSLNPLIKVPFELVMNRSISTDRPIARYEGQQKPLFEQLQGSPKFSAKLLYALGQFGGSLVNVPRSSVGQFTSYEQEIPDRPRQVMGFQSLLPLQRPFTAFQASQYRYRDKLIAAIQAAQEQGKYIPTIQELRNPQKRALLPYLTARNED